MIALKTSLNGNQLSLAGAEDLCVLNSIVNAVGRLGDLSKPQNRSDETPDLFLSVGGLTGREDAEDKHLNWIQQQPLNIGDEITIKVLDVREVDPPSSSVSAQSTNEDHQRYVFEQAKKTYLKFKDQFEPEEIS